MKKSSLRLASREKLGAPRSWGVHWRRRGGVSELLWRSVPLMLLLSACDDEGYQEPPIPPLLELPDFSCEQCDIAPPLEVDQALSAVPACGNDIDDDGDGLIDGFDPGCDGPDDRDEEDPTECNNGLDDDGDGRVDFPDDPGCADRLGADESSETPPPSACSNGEDDDGDGWTDFPLDSGCASADDLSEGEDVQRMQQCADGVDNDRDQLVDLSDPGCESPDDTLELNGRDEERPQCADGIDNDGDRRVDFPEDPGCSAAGDRSEQTPPRAPRCADELDNDEDGLIDFPDDPGCAGFGDGDEVDPIPAPACSDGIDNDNDGRIDYPDDDGCAGRGDGLEVGACGEIFESSQLVNGEMLLGELGTGSRVSEGSCGGRGGREIAFYYRVDRPLDALYITTDLAANTVETALYIRRRCADPESELICVQEPLNAVAANTLRLERPEQGDYYIFFDGATNQGGPFALDFREIPIPECRNGRDDDLDGLIDFPDEPGCESREDSDETDPREIPACSDEEDNDGDALSDFPYDPGCLFAGDKDEEDLCGDGVPVEIYPTGQPFIIGDSSREGSNRFEGSCGGRNIREKIFFINQPYSASLTISVDYPETEQPTLLHLRRTQCAREGGELVGEEDLWANEIACNLGGEGGKAVMVVPYVSPGGYFLFVDHPDGVGGPFKLSVTATRTTVSCQNLIDDDQDGLIDSEDPGCSSLDDDREDDEDPDAPPVACDDREDNDSDGLIDFPVDPGCETRGDVDEADPERLPVCSNLLDDDQDDLIDFPLDPGCSAASDETELDPRPSAPCSNRIDDDRDGLIDYPTDPGCEGAGSLSELDRGEPPACADGLDNDEDGATDYPAEVGCQAASGRSEEDPESLPACADGVDNDGDGLTDFPFELGCVAASDNDELDPERTPSCSNGRDDDRDGHIDWPEDPQCSSAGDLSERR